MKQNDKKTLRLLKTLETISKDDNRQPNEVIEITNGEFTAKFTFGSLKSIIKELKELINFDNSKDCYVITESWGAKKTTIDKMCNNYKQIYIIFPDFINSLDIEIDSTDKLVFFITKKGFEDLDYLKRHNLESFYNTVEIYKNLVNRSFPKNFYLSIKRDLCVAENKETGKLYSIENTEENAKKLIETGRLILHHAKTI